MSGLPTTFPQQQGYQQVQAVQHQVAIQLQAAYTARAHSQLVL
jgi:hypothetical protein